MKMLVLQALLLITGAAFYSPYFRKCRVGIQGIDIGSLPIQRVHRYQTDFAFPQPGDNMLDIKYEDLDFLYLDYIGAGGSGQVYLIEEERTSTLKVMKRFFKEKPFQFAKENFIMDRMNYPISWHHEDNNPENPTLATYFHKQSSTLSDTEIDNLNENILIFYKLCKQLYKSHQNGVIHNDLKRGNILINSVGLSLMQIQVQLIDWNLASFYYPGYESDQKHGTVCYHSPQLLLKTGFLTPATDVWSLAIVFFTYLTHKKPYQLNCKKNGIASIASLVGSQNLMQMVKKYNIDTSTFQSFFNTIQKNPHLYEPVSLKDRIPSKLLHIFDDSLIDLFQKMLRVDPEYRISIDEVINHPFFDRIKRLPSMYAMKNAKKQGNDHNKDAPADGDGGKVEQGQAQPKEL